MEMALLIKTVGIKDGFTISEIQFYGTIHLQIIFSNKNLMLKTPFI